MILRALLRTNSKPQWQFSLFLYSSSNCTFLGHNIRSHWSPFLVLCHCLDQAADGRRMSVQQQPPLLQSICNRSDTASMAFSALSVGAYEITKSARHCRINSTIQSHPFSCTDGLGKPRTSTAKAGNTGRIIEKRFWKCEIAESA